MNPLVQQRSEREMEREQAVVRNDETSHSVEPLQKPFERLAQLASAISHEAQALLAGKMLSELLGQRIRNLPTNFYEEVQRFETELIKLALERTGGNQARAAQLLSLKPTTLHAKIKNYRIA